MSTEVIADPMITASMRVRRAVPDALTPAIVRARTAALKRKNRAHVQARAEMSHLLDAVKPDDVARAANAYLYWYARRSEMRYHPRLTAFQDVHGIGHLTSARRQGRGVVLNFLHHGQYEGALASLGHAGEPAVLLVDPMMLAPDAPIFLRQHVSVARMGGNRAVPASIGSVGSRAILEAGEVLAVALDVPSRSRVQFLGKERLGSSGAARLAHATNSPVVTLSAAHDDGRLCVHVQEPIEPRDFDTPEHLLAHLLVQHESPVLAWPEAYHQPLLRWGTPD